ncbi:uncharacterized protein LOC132946563 [Metopolophium dirhodum]|uniref:uncharacterized protein LOC132946563 n=1 Tax=Metopolophium dirhodum TaxID=44670 RepID=UPI00298F49B3|nr:uncharacterized protein LOC132946563 [Metopolophium dirhodum]
MYARDVTEDSNVTSTLYVKKGKYGKPPIKGTMYVIPDFKEDRMVPCSLPRAAGIKKKRVQTDASDRTFKKAKHEKLSIVGSTYQRDVAKDGNVSLTSRPIPPPQHIAQLEVVYGGPVGHCYLQGEIKMI